MTWWTGIKAGVSVEVGGGSLLADDDIDSCGRGW